MRFQFICFFSVILTFALTGCWQNQGLPAPQGGDSDSDSDSDADADADGDTDTDTDIQGPVNLVLTNFSGTDKYLNWAFGAADFPRCRVQSGDDWDVCYFQQPWCTVLCDDIEEGDFCCMDCGYNPAVRVLEDGESFAFEWNGRLMPHDSELCSDCECYGPAIPEPGLYHVVWVVYDSYDCLTTDCEVDSDNIIQMAEPFGTYVDHLSEMHMIYEDDILETVIY